MAQAARDQNFVTTLLGVSSTDGVTPIAVYADPTTHRLLVDLAGGSAGTVQTISIATANGFAGTSDGDPVNPELTISTTLGAGEIPVGNGAGGFQSAPVTGAGNIVLSGSPTLTSPTLGSATAT